MLASTSFRRRGVAAAAAERAVEINGRDHRFLKAEKFFRSLFFAFLLHRATQDLAFHASGDGSFCFRR